MSGGLLGALIGLAICAAVFAFWFFAERRGAEQDRRWVLVKRAEEQHAAILKGRYCAGSYGPYWPPQEFRYLRVPDWRPDHITTTGEQHE